MPSVQRAACTHCQAVLKIKDPSYFGKKCVCPKCNKSFILVAEVDPSPSVTEEKTRNKRTTSDGEATAEKPSEIEQPVKKKDSKSKIEPAARKPAPVEDDTSADDSDLTDSDWPSSFDDELEDFEDPLDSEDDLPEPKSKRKSKLAEKTSSKTPAKNSKGKKTSKSGKGKSKSASPALFIGLAAVGILVVSVVCFILIGTGTKGNSPNTASSKVAPLDTEWVPNDVTAVLQVRFNKKPNAVLFLQGIKGNLAAIVGSEEINFDLIDQVTIGLPTGSTIETMNTLNSITVIRLKSVISPEIKSRLSTYTTTTLTGNSKTLYSKTLGKRGSGLTVFMFQPNDRTLVIGPENLIVASATEKRSPSRFQWVDGAADLVYAVSSDGEKSMENLLHLQAVNYDCLSVSADFTDVVQVNLGVHFKDPNAAKSNLETVKSAFKASVDVQVEQLTKSINDFAIQSELPTQLGKVSGSITATSRDGIVRTLCQVPNEAFDVSNKIKEDLK